MCTQDGGTLPGSPLRLSSLPRSRSLGRSGQVPSHPQGVQGHFSGGGWGADGPAGAQLGYAAQIPDPAQAASWKHDWGTACSILTARVWPLW